MHVHPECGDLQTAQADDAILGASDSDVIHCEEPVTVGIRLEGKSGLQVTPPGLKPSAHFSQPPCSVRFHQVRAPVCEETWR